MQIIMIRTLRKKHLQIWLTIAVLLPVGIISAWLAVPQPVRDHLLQPSSTASLPLIIAKIENSNYTINLRGSADRSSLQLEWINNGELAFPSAIIYRIVHQDEKIEDAAIIGRIDGRGTYLFPLKKDSSNIGFHFVLYDIIHHQVIGRINLNQ
jgi:hypothetical protein